MIFLFANRRLGEEIQEKEKKKKRRKGGGRRKRCMQASSHRQATIHYMEIS